MPKVVFIGDIHKQIELCIFFGRGVRRGNRLVINLLYPEREVFFRRSFIVHKDTTYFSNRQNV